MKFLTITAICGLLASVSTIQISHLQNKDHKFKYVRSKGDPFILHHDKEAHQMPFLWRPYQASKETHRQDDQPNKHELKDDKHEFERKDGAQ